MLERWLTSMVAKLAVGLGAHGHALPRAIAWRLTAATVGVATMGWLLTDATRALMTAAPAGAMAETRTTPMPAQPVVRDTATTGAIPARDVALVAPDWVAEQPRRMGFELRLKEVMGEAVRHGARRDRHSGAREEIITAGRFEGEGPWFVMSLARSSEPPSRLAVTLARRSSERGIVLARSGNSGPLATKFGPIEAADITLSGASSLTESGREGRACIGFRHAPDDVALTITGWFCGTGARPADRASLACLIERIGVAAAGDDAALRQHFARAELNRQAACNPTCLQAAGRRTTWLDPAAALPPLRRGAS